jgi:hypothetical protein
VNSKGPTGEIKVSALKQFGLLEGTSKAYAASELARTIAASPQEDLLPLYSRAALSPTVFKSLFDTFHGDEVTTGKLRQRAAELNVHPDNLTSCVSNYVTSLALAGLAQVDGETIVHKPAVAEASTTGADSPDTKETDKNGGADLAQGENERNPPAEDEALAGEESQLNHGSPRAIFNVNVNLDSSLDTEKLERQLALLKRYGAI